MRKRVRGSAPDRFELNLTPLLDVVLQLITFFMILVHFGSRIEGQTATIRLPITSAALLTGDLGLDRLVVAVDRKGLLIVEGESRDEHAATLWWRDQAKIRRDAQRIVTGSTDEISTQVVIRADREASYGSVRRTLAAAQNSGFARFSLVVLRGGRP